ncbi:hypothetical protein Ngar_c03600 [Candidatus Nitrososphaera gargensis Ga9.2]|uniref:Uncharacterized protein n=2 Tax=Candidatus Nitrososphaera gargensis TaxID=497727 RepID=K0IET8_NITGG|nr:hypothetical protein Ngar_c03310 [Candidatus Nitrososphaera gargensis Ga9.2]AFU57308.1 hypothetical protein Ngar_c03600 [Candidatus Nitrososphaera gargensis Ga9.2]
MNKAKEVEEWFRRNLIPVLFIALGMVLVAVFAGTKAGRQVVKKAVGAPIKR